MTGEGSITTDFSAGIGIFTIVNPARRNALQPAMRTALATAINAANADRSVRAIVIRGDGAHFCAGADMTTIGNDGPEPTTIELTERIRDAQNLVRSVALGAKPVIAAVEGSTYGAGLSLAAACDFVVCAEGATFGASFTNLGITAEFGLFSTLPRRVGHQAARRIITLSEKLDGPEALRLGLADRLTADGQALAAAMALAAQLAELPPNALAVTKRAFAADIGTIDDALRLELDIMPLLAGSGDFREAVAAFRDKRPPRFTGR